MGCLESSFSFSFSHSCHLNERGGPGTAGVTSWLENAVAHNSVNGNKQGRGSDLKVQSGLFSGELSICFFLVSPD